MESARPEDEIPAEFESLVHQYSAAIEAGELEEAKSLIAQVMALAVQKATEDPTPEMVRSLLADEAEENGQWADAERIYLELLEGNECERHAGVRAMQKSRLQMRLAHLEYAQGRMESAFALARQAVETARGADSAVHLAMIVDQFCGYALETQHFAEVLQAANEGLAGLDTGVTSGQLRAMLLIRKARVHVEYEEHEAAQASLDEALVALKPFAGMSEAAGVQNTLTGWWRCRAELSTSKGNWNEARAAWQRAVELSRHVMSLWEDSRRAAARHLQILERFARVARDAGDVPTANAAVQESAAVRTRLGLD